MTSEDYTLPLFSYLYSAPLVQQIDDELKEVDLLDYVNERRALKSMLERQGGSKVSWKSEVANVNNFLHAYSNSKILHFTGHGENGQVAFEDNYGKLKFITHAELSQMCNGLNHKPECVFLSACFAETVSDAFVGVGIPHIVTVTNERVLDKASLAFTDTFYSALLNGKPVSEAFNLGIARLVAQHPTERVKFDLRGSGDHEKPIFPQTDAIPRQLADLTDPLPECQCHAPAMFSVGRFLEVQQVYGLLRNEMKLVNITGQRGIGKTEVALRVAEYARERYAFSRLLFLEMNTITGEGAETVCLERLALAFRIPLPPVVDVDSIVESIRRSLRQDEQIMLLLDGVDFWFRKKRDFLVSLVGRLRQRLGDLWIVLTSQQYIEIEACREVVVEMLSDIHTAQLFALRSPRNLDRDELTLEASETHSDPIHAFSRTKLLQAMKGNPRVVELVAKELHYEGQPQNLLRYETYFREEIIPSIIHQVLYVQDPLTWQDCCMKIRNTYRRCVGIEVCRVRPLAPEDFIFFASCSAWGDSNKPSQNGYAVNPIGFESFSQWLDGILSCLKKSELWSRPHCIFGFIDRGKAAELLRDSDIGTFLIGVSQTEPCLVINVVTSPGKVLPVKVKVDPNSPTPFSSGHQRGMTSSYLSLEDLLISNQQLLYFYRSDGAPPIEKLTLLPQT